MPFAALARAWVAVVALPWPLHCSLVAERRPEPESGPVTAPVYRPDAPSAAAPKREVVQERVSPAEPAAPPERAVRLPDQVVVKLLDGGHSAFLACWARAQRADPTLMSAKVSVHIELDPAGHVQTIANDAELVTFHNCVSFVASHLGFPSVGKPVVVEFPLLFR
jgi:hypothetical protein